MSLIFFIFLIFIVCLCSSRRVRKTTAMPEKHLLPFPHLIEFKESDIGKPYYTFDGVDYDKIPIDIYDRDFKNCYEEYTTCTRFTLYANPVCGYHRYENKLFGYYSICELDLASCKDMKRKRIPMHGTTYRDRSVFFMGEGSKCETYVRRIAEGLVPRDIRDPLPAGPEPIMTMKNKYHVVARAKALQQDNTEPNYIPNSEYGYEDTMY